MPILSWALTLQGPYLLYHTLDLHARVHAFTHTHIHAHTQTHTHMGIHTFMYIHMLPHT